MELVLYHPEEGYYHKPGLKIGKFGDFVTSSVIHPVFGRTLARFLIELLQKEQLPFYVCEIGAGTGQLTAAIIEEWENLSPSTYNKLKYFVVETSASHRELLNDRFTGEMNVQIYENLSQLRIEESAFSGILFSNEFFDALPVRVVEKAECILYEVMVTLGEDGELKEELKVCRDPLILEWIDTLNFPIHEGERVEIPLVMTNMMNDLANWLDRGTILTFDYGYTNKDRTRPERRNGSLRGYKHHRLVEDLLLNPGKMDLTAHVHWDVYDQIAKSAGLHRYFSVSQREFLLKSGVLAFLKETGDSKDPFSGSHKQNRAIRSLISEDSFGHAYQTILHGKGIDTDFIKNWKARQPIEEAIKKDDER